VNLDEGWIRVAAKFDNKTETKRFVQIEPNLKLWLEPCKKDSGRVVPKNLRTRRRWITRGKYQCPPGPPEDKWTQLVPFGSELRDITRHTFGSFLEAKYRDRNRVKEAMGHADFKTYEQHYRNARSPQEAEAFWSIVPPPN
jgi:integrase